MITKVCGPKNQTRRNHEHQEWTAESYKLILYLFRIKSIPLYIEDMRYVTYK